MEYNDEFVVVIEGVAEFKGVTYVIGEVAVCGDNNDATEFDNDDVAG